MSALEPLIRRRWMVAAAVLLALVAGASARVGGAEAATAKSYSAYLNEVRPMLIQWRQGLHSWQGGAFLTEPTTSNTSSAAQMQQLLHQWWGAIEQRRGFHFLTQPVPSNTDTAVELHQLLNQWQNAIEAWRGTHFLSEPPTPFSDLFVRSVGAFDLSPERRAVRAGRPLRYEIDWRVPRPNNWHDLRTIDLRVCGRNGLLWLRWTELKDTLSLLNPRTGRTLATGRVGAARRLISSTAELSLRRSSTTGSGQTGRSVTLALVLRFQPRASGRTCGVQLAARDDLGNRDRFERAGRIRIR